MFQMSPVWSQQPMLPNASTKPMGNGMFGGDRWKDAIAAALMSFAAGNGSQTATAMMAQMMQQRRDRERVSADEAQYQRHRGDELADYGKKKEIDAQYPGDPHYFEDNSGNLMAIGPDGKPAEVYHDPNPWKLVPNGMGGVVPVNMQELMRGQSGLPPIGSVVADPRKAGGQTAPLSGPFPDIGPYRRY